MMVSVCSRISGAVAAAPPSDTFARLTAARYPRRGREATP